MDVPQVVDLSSRLHRLEIAVIVLTVLVFALAFLFLSGLASRTLLVLRGRRGKGRIVVARSEAGDPEITLMGRDSVAWFRMGFDPDGGPMIDLGDRSGHLRFLLAMAKGGPAFSLHNEDGEPRMFAGFHGNKVPGMTVSGPTGKQVFQFSLDESGSPYLMVFDSEAKSRLAVGISPSGDPALVFCDREGQERMAFGFDEKGDPFFHLLDAEGAVVSQMPPWKAETGEL